MALWRAAFGGTLEPAVWLWKYHGEFGHRAMVAEHRSGRLMAMFGGVPCAASLQGRPVEIVHLWDNMSHPAYRGLLGGRRGVYVRTVDAFIETYCGPGKAIFLYGFPGDRHFRLGQRTLRYGRLDEAACLELEPSPSANRNISERVDLMVRADERLDRMAAELDRIYPFWVRRDRRFVQWRYFDHPRRRYRVYGLRKLWSRALKGMAVIAAEDDDTGILVDLILPVGDTESLGFLRRLRGEWHRAGWRRIRTWVPANHPARRCLQAAGFEIRPEPLGIIPTGRSFSPDLDGRWAAANLYYTMGDGDLF
ncbi:MAG: GNAT family N-acetyltransferase [Methylothermaceae bacterium]|nr:GNAT family N-acetyltransferase [Methylothermaceae bacterium]